MLALGMMAGLLYYLKEPFFTALHLSSLAQDRATWQNIENDLRQSVVDASLFELARKKSPELDACLRVDDVTCKTGPQPITFYLSDSRATTGLFKSQGVSCSGSSCPIAVEATFTGLCRTAGPCDVAGTIEVDYRILIDQKLFRQGYLQRPNKEKLLVDENISCGVNDLGRSGFAHSIGPMNIDCVLPLRLNRKVTGIELGDCARGREVLVGFDSGGKRICSDVKRSNP